MKYYRENHGYLLFIGMVVIGAAIVNAVYNVEMIFATSWVIAAWGGGQIGGWLIRKGWVGYYAKTAQFTPTQTAESVLTQTNPPEPTGPYTFDNLPDLRVEPHWKWWLAIGLIVAFVGGLMTVVMGWKAYSDYGRDSISALVALVCLWLMILLIHLPTIGNPDSDTN